MEVLTETELKELKGGFSLWVGASIVSAIIFIVGVIDGLVHPKSCDKTT